MNLKIDMTPDVETRLRERAAREGLPLEEFVRDALMEKLGEPTESHHRTRPLHGREWSDELASLLAMAPRISHAVDDSRESIYEGRGE